MNIELPEYLCERLGLIVQPNKAEIENLVVKTIWAQLPALRASVEPDYQGNITEVTPAASRRAVELRAIRARLREWDPQNQSNEIDAKHNSLMQRIAREIPVTSFIMQGCADLAREIDMGSIRNFADLPADFAELREEPSSDESALDQNILRHMSVDEIWLEVLFNVHVRVPLPGNITCNPFGGARKIELIAGRSAIYDAPTTQLVGVRIEVPIVDLSDRDEHDLSARIIRKDGGYVLERPEFDKARALLEHIFTVLRLQYIDIRYSDHRSDLGVPNRARIFRTFHDGSTVSRSIARTYGWASDYSPNVRVAGTPLINDPDLFKDAFEKCADELALLTNASILIRAERFRRTALIIESAFSEALPPPGQEPFEVDQHEKRRLAALVNSQEFVQRVSLVLQQCSDWQQAYPTPGTFAEDLVQLRDKVSHLQKHKFVGSMLQDKIQRYGLDIYDGTFSSLLDRVAPIARALAIDLVKTKAPSLALEPYHKRKPQLAELLSLLESDAYFLDLKARHAVESIVFERLSNGENGDERAEKFIMDQLALSNPHYGAQLAKIASAYSDRTRLALVEAIRCSDVLSQVATRELTLNKNKYPQVYEALENRLLSNDDLSDLLTILGEADADIIAGRVSV